MDNDERALDTPETLAENQDVEEQVEQEELAGEAVAEAEETVEEAPVEEVPVEEAAVEETPAAELAADQPVDEAEIPVDETPVDEAPAEEAALEQAALEDAAGEPAVDEAPADEASLEVAAEAPVEQAAPVVDADEVHEQPALSEDDVFLKYMSGEVDVEGAVAALKKGEIVEGTIARVGDSEIIVDVGAKSEGVVGSRDFEKLDREFIDSLEVGQSVRVFVVSPEGQNGHPVLSLNRAMEEQDWEQAEAYLVSKDVYESKVAGYNKGGLIVPFGRIRGFVPASQISMERKRRSEGETPKDRWGGMVNEPIRVKVVEVDHGRNRLILSERAAMQEQRAARRAELMDELEVGQVRQGRVVRLTDFGAFVDIGGADGLIHLSELSWQHVGHPKEVLNVGDSIEVEVISVDPERQRIGLSRKNVLPDPWDELAREYQPGQLVQATVTKLTKFGAFASLVDRPEIEGLIHISEMAEHRVVHPRDVVNEGDVLTLRILRIETDRRRLGLSLKRVDSAEYIDDDWSYFAESATGDDE